MDAPRQRTVALASRRRSVPVADLLSSDFLVFHPRVSGNRRRGWGLVVGSVVLVVAGVAAVDISQRYRGSDAWFMALPLTAVPATVAFLFGVKEVRRPVQADGRGRCRNRRIEGAELRWHPTFAGIADEVRGIFERTSAKRGASLGELARGRTDGSLILHRPPFRPGGRARMRFVLRAERRWFLPEQFGFTLRCLREDPQRLLAIRSPIECGLRGGGPRRGAGRGVARVRPAARASRVGSARGATGLLGADRRRQRAVRGSAGAVLRARRLSAACGQLGCGPPNSAKCASSVAQKSSSANSVQPSRRKTDASRVPATRCSRRRTPGSSAATAPCPSRPGTRRA
jgi:hypothetical protein